MPDNPSAKLDDAAQDLSQVSKPEKADVELGATLARHRDHPLIKAAGAAGKIGDQGPLYAVSGVVFAVGLAARHRRLAGSGVAMLLALAAADVSKRLTKRLVRRTRPHVLLDNGRYETDLGEPGGKREQSFPSGHTAGTVAVARALSRNFPKSGAAAGVAAVGIGVSRVAKGAHWPLDVLGGAVVGLAAEALSAMLLRFGWRAYARRRVH
jgi:membrane-associated phospholipid phosphatase